MTTIIHLYAKHCNVGSLWTMPLHCNTIISSARASSLGKSLGWRGARPLIAAILPGPSPDLGPLILGDGVNPVFAGLAAGQDPGGVE
jgi:hypothetical protein